MKYKLLLICGVLFISLSLFGQSDFKPGYIITHENDTLRGFIDLKANSINSNHCDFKPNENTDPKTYFPKDIKAYRIADLKYYVAREVKPDSIQITLFLEYLVDGIADLFYLRKDDKDMYFLEKDGEMYQLTSEERLVNYTAQSITEARKYGGKSVNYYRRTNKYLGLLNIAFSDCPELKTKINNTDFAYKPLIKLTKEYHDKMCSDAKCIDYSKSTKNRVYIEPVAGVIFSRNGMLTSHQYENNVSYIVGANVRLLPLQSHYVWNLLIGINYSQNKLENIFSHDLEFDASVVDPVKIKADYSIIRIPISVEYTFPMGKLSPLLIATYSNCFLVNASSEARAVYMNNDDSYTLGTPYNQVLQKFDYGVGGGVGLKYKNGVRSYGYLKCEYEYRASYSINAEIFDYLKTNSVMITFAYGFRL